MSGKLPMSNYSDTSITILCLLSLLFGGCWGLQGGIGGYQVVCLYTNKTKKKLITKNNNYANYNNRSS